MLFLRKKSAGFLVGAHKNTAQWKDSIALFFVIDGKSICIKRRIQRKQALQPR
jgi:hypothetical protein